MEEKHGGDGVEVRCDRRGKEGGNGRGTYCSGEISA